MSSANSLLSHIEGQRRGHRRKTFAIALMAAACGGAVGYQWTGTDAAKLTRHQRWQALKAAEEAGDSDRIRTLLVEDFHDWQVIRDNIERVALRGDAAGENARAFLRRIDGDKPKGD